MPRLRVCVLLFFWAACGDDAATSPDGRVTFDAPPVPIDGGPPDAPPNPATGAWRSGFRLPCSPLRATMLKGIGFFDAGAWHPYGTGMAISSTARRSR